MAALQQNEPDSATQRRQHTKILTQLTDILNKPIGRQLPRVDIAPSTSTDHTHPSVLRMTKRVHQRRTRSNNPYDSFLNDQQTATPADVPNKAQRTRRQIKRVNKRTTQAAKVSNKTLDRVIRAQKQMDELTNTAPSPVTCEGGREPTRPEDTGPTPIQITQDDADGDSTCGELDPTDELEVVEPTPPTIPTSPFDGHTV